VAEDALANQVVIKRLLEKVGLEVLIANDGAEAVALAQSQSLDLIFMDIQMPNVNGFEATRLLRQTEAVGTGSLPADKIRRVPIVALTAYAMKEDAAKCREAGCDDYLSKPIRRESLYKILAKHLPQKNEGSTKP